MKRKGKKNNPKKPTTNDNPITPIQIPANEVILKLLHFEHFFCIYLNFISRGKKKLTPTH